MRYFVLFFALILASCGSQKKATEVAVDNRPEWVKNFPLSDEHYVGVGIANKASHPTDYMQVAQQNALQHLASQIKVSIATQSVFLQMEREYGFEEEFKSDIKIKAQEHLEGYELMGTHQEGNEYWVYYRLSKRTYAEIRQARMEEAIDRAKQHLAKAESKIDLKERYIQYTKSLEVLKPFLSEPLATTFEREQVYLGSEIISRFRIFLNDFRLSSLDEKLKVMVGHKLGDIRIAVEYQGERTANIPLILSSEILEVEAFSQATDEKGVFIAIVPRITSTEAVQKIEVGIDIAQWIAEATKDPFIEKLVRGVQTHQITIPVYVYTPLVYVSSTEKVYGQKTNQQELKYAAESALNKFGFTPTANKDEAQLFMHIDAQTEEGRQQNGQKMFTAFLNLKMQVKDLNGLILFSEQLNKLKGIQLSFEQANSKAYQAGQEALHEKLVVDFVDGFIAQ